MLNKIERDQRPDKLVEAFDGNVMLGIEVEMTTYAYASKFIKEYDGGRWEFWEGDQGRPDGGMVFAMSWDTDKESVTLENPDNYSMNETDPHSAGLAVYTMALNHLGFKYMDRGEELKASLLFTMQENVQREIYTANDNKREEDQEIDVSAVYQFLD